MVDVVSYLCEAHAPGSWQVTQRNRHEGLVLVKGVPSLLSDDWKPGGCLLWYSLFLGNLYLFLGIVQAGH